MQLDFLHGGFLKRKREKIIRGKNDDDDDDDDEANGKTAMRRMG